MDNSDLFKKLKHLYWRAGCGPGFDILSSPPESIECAVEDIFINADTFELFEYRELLPEFNKTNSNTEDLPSMSAMPDEDYRRSDYRSFIIQKWINALAGSTGFFREKMAFFWGNHFACKIGDPKVCKQHANMLRKFALGNFRDLLIAVSQSPGMISYLNTNVSTKQRPNENFSRELMEIFTLGQGNYSESDVKQSSRAFTGWDVNDISLEFENNPFKHDFESKTFLNEYGQFNGWDIIDIILKQKQCSRFIVTKIYSYFVNDKTDPFIIEDLTDFFYTHDYNITLLMKKIFLSDWFYSEINIGAKLKTPFDFLSGLIKFYNIQFENFQSFHSCHKFFSHDIFHPPSVAGWNFDLESLDATSLVTRVNASRWIFESPHFKAVNGEFKPDLNTDGSKVTLQMKYSAKAIEDIFKKDSFEKTTAFLSDFIIQRPDRKFIPSDIDEIATGNNPFEIARKIMSFPEYQFC